MAIEIKDLTAIIGSVIAALSLYIAFRNRGDNSKNQARAVRKYRNAVIRSHNAPVSRFRYGTVKDAISLQCTLNSGSKSYQLRELLLQLATKETRLRRPIIVLGEYGQGKSIACGAVALVLAQRWKRRLRQHSIPVLIPLREKLSLPALGEAALRSAESLYQQSIPDQVFSELKSEGLLTFILDGLDEWVERDSETDGTALITALLEHPTFRNNQLVLTSRPNAMEPEMLKRLESDCDVVRIQFPRISQIYQYLQVHKQAALLALAQKPGNEHFADLIKRPLFLDMAMASADLLANVENVTQHKIYFRYFQSWYERELLNLGPEMRRLTFDNIDDILSRTAHQMAHHNTHTISSVDLASIVRATSGIDVSAELIYLRRQVSRRLLLVPDDRDQERRFTFRHDSLESYFLARYLYKAFLNRQSDPFLSDGVDSTTLSFFVTIASDTPEGDQVIRAMYATDMRTNTTRADIMGAAILLWAIRSPSVAVDSEYLRNFCARSSPACRKILLSHLSHANLSGCDLSHTDLSSASMQNANLSRSTLRGTILTGVRLDGADLTSALLDEAVMDGASLKYAKLHKAQLVNLRTANVNFQEAVGSGTALSSSRFTQSNFAKCNLDGSAVDLCTFVDCDFAGAALTNLRSCSSNCWEMCELVGASFHGTACVSCSFPASNSQLALGLPSGGAQ